MDAQVFVSYAPSDNEPFDEETNGWVTEFVEKLQKAISLKIGGKELRCGMDHRLYPQPDLNDTDRKRIAQSHCFLAFMSPGFLKSSRCQQELAAFVEMIRDDTVNERIFIVELLPTERISWHSGIQSVPEIRLWDEAPGQSEPMLLGWPVPNAKEDKEYWQRINSLAGTLAGRVQILPPVSSSNKDAPKSTSPDDAISVQGNNDHFDVFLSHNSQDKPIVRDLAKALTQRDIRVWLDEEQLIAGQLWQESLEKIIRTTRTAAVLIGPSGLGPWEKPEMRACLSEFVSRELPVIPVLLPGTPQKPGLPLFLRSFMWVDLREGLSDQGMEKLVKGITFGKQDQETRDLNTGLPDSLSVVINADKPDQDLGKQARDILIDLDVEATLAALPLPKQDPARYRGDLETQLECSNGVLIVYGTTPPSWVQSRQAQARKVLAMRRKGVWGALLDGPPEDKPEHGLRSPNLMLLDCRRGISADPLKRFVDSLRQGNQRV